MKAVLGVLLVALLASLCHSAEPKPNVPKPGPRVRGTRPDVPAWHDRYDLPWEVVPADLKFKNAEAQAALVRADAAARKIATPEWKTQAGKAYPYLHWNAGSPGGYWRTYSGRWESGSAPQHSIALLTEVYANDGLSPGFQLLATYDPPGGWKASLGCSYRGAPETLGFTLTFSHPRHTSGKSFGDPSVGLQVAPGTTSFYTRRRVNNRDVRVAINNYRRDERGGIRFSTVEEVAQYWKSPESFRDATLAEYDRLAEMCRQQLKAGLVIEVWTLGGPTGADVPMRLGPSEQVDDKLKADILREALAYVDDRKALVTAHYEEMHRSATSSFEPLVEVLSGK